MKLRVAQKVAQAHGAAARRHVQRQLKRANDLGLAGLVLAMRDGKSMRHRRSSLSKGARKVERGKDEVPKCFVNRLSGGDFEKASQDPKSGVVVTPDLARGGQLR